MTTRRRGLDVVPVGANSFLVPVVVVVMMMMMLFCLAPHADGLEIGNVLLMKNLDKFLLKLIRHLDSLQCDNGCEWRNVNNE